MEYEEETNYHSTSFQAPQYFFSIFYASLDGKAYIIRQLLELPLLSPFCCTKSARAVLCEKTADEDLGCVAQARIEIAPAQLLLGQCGLA